LNRLANQIGLLPTGTDPISVVKTYLYCSSEANKRVSVKGVNQKNVLVSLNTGVLQAIKHANKSNTYLASVLEKLFVEISSQDLNGLVFIDTPGYNNSDKANESNGKTDRETATEALGEGNVLFWFIDSEKGTTVSEDLQMIKQFKGKKVIIFNKADKKGETEAKKIVHNAADVLYQEFPREEIIDILAFSTLENQIYYSINKLSRQEILQQVRQAGNGISQLNSLKASINRLFEDEVAASRKAIGDIKERYKDEIGRMNEAQKSYQNAKEYQEEVIGELNTVMVESYNKMMETADRITKSGQKTIKDFSDFYDDVVWFENNDHWGSSSVLTQAIHVATDAYNFDINNHNTAIKYTYYKEEYRKNLVNRIDQEEDFVVEQLKNYYDDSCADCEASRKRMQQEEDIIKKMQAYQVHFMKAIETGIRQYRQHNEATAFTEEVNTIPNVFEAIRKDDYKAFLRSFENEVNLTLDFNAEGYNPLTYAVQSGNNMMVQFFLSHDADPAFLDKRGYNAFHTAVENQYRDICKILLDKDPELINSKTEKGETIEMLARKNSFAQWVETEMIDEI
jgi:GTP-binding protein EngB required for normal cell division